jgi:hypothetical protein
MTGAIAEAYYKTIPEDILVMAMKRLPDEFKAIIKQFQDTYEI